MKNNYRVITVNGVRFLEHRYLIEKAFGPIEKGFVVNHKNGKKYDNRLCNLEVVTKSQNSQHAWKTGLSKPPKYPLPPKKERVKMVQKKNIIKQTNLMGNKMSHSCGYKWVTRVENPKKCPYCMKRLPLVLKVKLALLLGLLLSTPAFAQDGFATYYTTASCKAEGNSGIYTANGERYNEQAMTCALPHRRFGGFYVVYSPATGRSVVVRHNDLGPGKGPRKRAVIIDLSPSAFKAVCGDLSLGKCEVSVQEVI